MRNDNIETRVGPYCVRSSREVYANPWLRLREDRVIRPGGGEGVFGVVAMKPGSTVLALNDRDEVYLVNEFKYGIERESLELVSGAIEPGENPIDAARRELAEELGLEADLWTDLGVVNPFTTVVNSPNYLFLARGVRQGTAHPDDGEVLETVILPLTDAVEMVMRGEITHAGSCTLLLKAARYLQRR